MVQIRVIEASHARKVKFPTQRVHSVRVMQRNGSRAGGNMNQGLEPLVIKHRPLLLALAKNLCGSAVDAEDLVQEALLRFMMAFGESVPPAERTCIAWLTTTLHNLFFTHLRKGKVYTK